MNLPHLEPSRAARSAGRAFRAFALAALSLAFVATGAASAFAGPLADYIGNGDTSYAMKIENHRIATDANPYDAYDITLTSQTWRGLVWKHALTVFVPKELAKPDTALILITGGSNTKDGEPNRRPSSESLIVAQIAVQLKTVAAVLAQVPNQPILDGRSEDAAIAYTFDQFLKTGEKDWPLLFPMAKSAIRAMDAVQQVCESEAKVKVSKFFVTGASKRGWTTWLTGASDPRVIGIAPLVIDNLNMPKQMPHQKASWGDFSKMIEDYTVLGLAQKSDDPEVARILSVVDPYAYLESLKMPKLMVNGANDPYWVIDAARFYFDDLKGERYSHYVANAGHGLGPGAPEAIAGFYEMVRDGRPRPKLEWNLKGDTDHVDLELSADQAPRDVCLWTALSKDDRDHRDEVWNYVTLTPSADGKYRARIGKPAKGHLAFYVELMYPSGDGKTEFGLCTTVAVVGGGEVPSGEFTSSGGE